MKKSGVYKKIMLLTVVLVAVVSVVGISYAAWANQLNADNVFELRAAEVTHLTFGSDSNVAVDGLAEPGKTLSASATVKTTNATLSVTFKISKLEVKLVGSDVFQDVKQIASADFNLFALTVVGSTNNTVSVGSEPTALTFNFVMRADKVNTELYPNATFRLTVEAIGALLR